MPSKSVHLNLGINNSWFGFDSDKTFFNILKQNLFPAEIIDKVLNRYLKLDKRRFLRASGYCK